MPKEIDSKPGSSKPFEMFVDMAKGLEEQFPQITKEDTMIVIPDDRKPAKIIPFKKRRRSGKNR